MTSSNGNTVVAPGELTFLVELRDYLNSAASPATGSTIAFSTFVSDRAGGFRAEDARKAYPGYRTLARQLRWFVTTISFLALLSTVVLAGLAAYVYWGNAIVNAAANVYTQEADLQKDIAREQASGETSRAMLNYASSAQSPSGATDVQVVSGGQTPGDRLVTGIVPLCEAFADVSYDGKPVQAWLTSTQENLCVQELSLKAQLHSYAKEAVKWQNVFHLSLLTKLDGRPDTELLQIAPHFLSMINGYLIPLLMGFLGSSAFVLRGFLKRLGDRMLTTRDLQANAVRIVLGILSGLAIGFFLAPSGGGGTSPQNSLGMGINLTAPALAFLAGYAVEVLFKFLDTIAGQAFASK